MKITFEIYYHTRWGESLFLSGDIDELGANEENRAVMRESVGNGGVLIVSLRGGMPGNIVWSIDGAMFLPICLFIHRHSFKVYSFDNTPILS